MSWEKFRKIKEDSLGRKLSLQEALELSKKYTMTAEELEKQEQSFIRAMKQTGDPRLD